MTFAGLSGLGDLSLTCSSEKSRNCGCSAFRLLDCCLISHDSTVTVGLRLGKGENLEDIIKSLGSVAEGVETTRAAFNLVERLKVDAPMIRTLYSVLFEGLPLKEGMQLLLTREMKSELSGIEDDEPEEDDRSRRPSLTPAQMTRIEDSIKGMNDTEF